MRKTTQNTKKSLTFMYTKLPTQNNTSARKINISLSWYNLWQRNLHCRKTHSKATILKPVAFFGFCVPRRLKTTVVLASHCNFAACWQRHFYFSTHTVQLP